MYSGAKEQEKEATECEVSKLPVHVTTVTESLGSILVDLGFKGIQRIHRDS